VRRAGVRDYSPRAPRATAFFARGWLADDSAAAAGALLGISGYLGPSARSASC